MIAVCPMNPRNISTLLVPILALCFPWVTRADVRLPALFSDGMVLQQNTRAPVWGWAEEGEEVTVTFRGKTVKTKAKEGKWKITLNRFKAGGPDEMVVEGRNRIQLKGVLVGEVWICSGQSNMELPLKSSFESASDIAACANCESYRQKASDIVQRGRRWILPDTKLRP